MLRSLPRAAPSSSSLLPRSNLLCSRPSPVTPIAITQQQQARQSTTPAPQHAISNPTLANIEKRWEVMPPPEQAELWMSLRDRMKVDWHELTLQERKAGKSEDPIPFGKKERRLEAMTNFQSYWIAFGPHGPRALPPPGEGWYVFRMTMLGVGVSLVLFALIRTQARPPPGTMNKEYQEMTNEYLKNQNTEPITGISSEGYTGKGQVQSKPKRKDI